MLLVAVGVADVLLGTRAGLLVLAALLCLGLVLLFVVVVLGAILDDVDLDLRLGRWMQLRLAHPRRRRKDR